VAGHPCGRDDMGEGELRALRFTKAGGLLAVGGTPGRDSRGPRASYEPFQRMESWSSAIRMVSLPQRLRAGEGSREEPRAERETSVEGRYAQEAALLRFTVDVDESAMLLDDAMAKVHEDLFDLCVVGFDGLKIGGNEFHFDVLVDDLVEETGEAVECFVEVAGAGLKGLATREGQEFASERSGAVGLLADISKRGKVYIYAIFIKI
jgi:hypothetical protein